MLISIKSWFACMLDHTFRSFFNVSSLLVKGAVAGVDGCSASRQLCRIYAALEAAKLRCSLGGGLGHGVEGADSALVDEDEIVELVLDVTARDQCRDQFDGSFVHLRLASLDGDAVDVVLAGDDIDADVLDGPLLVVGGDVVHVWGLVTDAALVFQAKPVLTSVVLVTNGFEFFLSPAILETVRIPRNGNRASKVPDDVLILAV